MARRLTTLGLQNLKPAGKRLEVSDGGSGLYHVIQPSGRRGWCVRYRFDGVTRKLTLKSGLTLAGARQAAASALLEVERGVDPAARKRTTGNTLREIAEAHLLREESKPADKRLRTIDQRRDTLERLIYPKLGTRPIGQIKRSEIVTLLDDIEANNGGRMADEVLSVLRIVCDFHARRDDDFRSPIVRGMTLTKPQDRIRNRVLSNDELAAVWRAADAMEGPFGRYVQYLLLTAARRNEAARMTLAEVKNG